MASTSARGRLCRCLSLILYIVSFCLPPRSRNVRYFPTDALLVKALGGALSGRRWIVIFSTQCRGRGRGQTLPRPSEVTAVSPSSRTVLVSPIYRPQLLASAVAGGESFMFACWCYNTVAGNVSLINRCGSGLPRTVHPAAGSQYALARTDG